MTTRDKNHRLHSDNDLPAVETKFTQVWYSHGKKHRGNDKPAAILKNINNSTRYKWYKRGKLHRDNGPAIICELGSMKWYKNGNLHRDYGPAVIDNSNGLEWWYEGNRHNDTGPAIINKYHTSWYINGKKHRDSDLPAEISSNGRRVWCKDGLIHRDAKPAIIDSESEKWYKNGLLHRTDGPAIVEYLKFKKNSWFINGIEIDSELINNWLKDNKIKNIPLSPDEQTLFLLTFP